MKLLGKGAEAELVECLFMGEPAVCKRRVRKRYRVHALDERLRSERTKNEARILHAAKVAGVPCPIVKHVDLVKKEIFLSRIDGKLLREAMPKLATGKKNALLKEAGGFLAALHDGGVAHGDSTTSNFMVDREGALWLIDFGLSEVTNSVEEQATDILLFKKAVAPREFAAFWGAYARKKTNSKLVARRLAEIEERGRYVVRSMAK